MTMAFDSTYMAQKDLAAAIHSFDKTLRPQIVSPKTSPQYHAIIKEFEKLTGGVEY